MNKLQRSLWRHQVNGILALVIMILPFIFLPEAVTKPLIFILGLAVAIFSFTGAYHFGDKKKLKDKEDFHEYESGVSGFKKETEIETFDDEIKAQDDLSPDFINDSDKG